MDGDYASAGAGCGWICESTLERLERSSLTNALLEREGEIDEIVGVLTEAGALSRVQVKRMKDLVEKGAKDRIGVLVDALLPSSSGEKEDSSLPGLLRTFRRCRPDLYESLAEALREEALVLEIEAKVRKNSRRRPIGKRGDPHLPSTKLSQQPQPPARRFAESDKRLIAGLIRQLSAAVTGSLATRSKAMEEELLGIRHRMCAARRDLTAMSTRLENRLLLSGFGSRLERREPAGENVDAGDSRGGDGGSHDDDGGNRRGHGFYESPQSLDEFLEKFARTLETFLRVFFSLKGKSPDFSISLG